MVDMIDYSFFWLFFGIMDHTLLPSKTLIRKICPMPSKKRKKEERKRETKVASVHVNFIGQTFWNILLKNYVRHHLFQKLKHSRHTKEDIMTKTLSLLIRYVRVKKSIESHCIKQKGNPKSNE